MSSENNRPIEARPQTPPASHRDTDQFQERGVVTDVLIGTGSAALWDATKQGAQIVKAKLGSQPEALHSPAADNSQQPPTERDA